MISIFTCPTEGCENNTNPVYMMDIINPVMCGLCQVFSYAVESEDVIPVG